MDSLHVFNRGSYIWGRSVHNVLDVTTQLGAKWAEFFTSLELHHGFNVNSRSHKWLLHYLFLPDINDELLFFTYTWNHHQIHIWGQCSCSPIDFFYFDMLVQDDVILPQNLELFGVDWEALWEPALADSQLQNNTITENTSSWIEGDLTVEDIGQLHTFISPWLPMLDHESLTQQWAQALAFVLGLNPNF
ncbi:hypothetical protein BS47DRAFT_1374524 [Hydnum rufescens UP504]|uniref:Integrase core domain-containing protein n=1 Tax=Hydnum rufescens UP504 TaxID=1448309 RepID=A0A9P6AAX6_9AGAM|nr:hypothetical protein BS47DRAFT_1374524 [Hydnum rufescens UP504]